MKFFENSIKLGKNLIISDIHLGLEDTYNIAGNQIPILVEKLIDKIIELQEKTKTKRLIINGDLKHSFSPIKEEFIVLDYFFKRLGDYFNDFIIIKGNHDTGIDWLSKYGDVLEYKKLYGYTITHGHKKIEGKKFIIGHEHPILKLRDEVGATIRVKTFLVSDNVIVLPAFSPWSYGNDILQHTVSPYTKNIENFRALVYLDGELLDFGRISEILKAIKSF